MSPEPTPAPTEAEPASRILKGPLFRQKGRSVSFAAAPPLPASTPAPVCRPAKVARMLALAHHLQRAIDTGLVADRAAAARKLGLTRARVTQLLDLLLLAPDLQLRVLQFEAVEGVEPTTERALRAVARHRHWTAQRTAFGLRRP